MKRAIWQVQLRFCGLRHGFVGNSAGTVLACHLIIIISFLVMFREISDPPKILSYLLQPSTSSLPSETISVYIQAAFKIFGHWVADLAARWNEDYLAEIKQAVEMMVGSLQSFVQSENIEVQERVRSNFYGVVGL